MERSLQRNESSTAAKVPRNKSSTGITVPSVDFSLLGTKVQRNEKSYIHIQSRYITIPTKQKITLTS